MPRPVNAMAQLIREVKDVMPDASYSYDEPDGYSRYRGIVFDPATTKAIAPLLDTLVKDRRVADAQIVGKGKNRRAAITFVGDIRADHATGFGIDAAYRLLSVTDADEPVDGSDGEVRSKGSHDEDAEAADDQSTQDSGTDHSPSQ